MATLDDEIAALESAIRRGVRTVEYNGERVEYRSLADMRSILAEMKGSQGATQPTHGGRFYPAFDRRAQ
ncbi:MAG: hypothetical protein AAFU61_01265 [Pseudomonadota bacterium]